MAIPKTKLVKQRVSQPTQEKEPQNKPLPTQCVTTKHVDYWNRIGTLVVFRTKIPSRNLHKSYTLPL